MERYKEVERSIITTYRKRIWNRFIGGIKDYQLITPGDKIAVCLSGGKDSMLLAKCMQELHRHSEIPFELEFLAMNPGYNKANAQLIEENAKELHVPVHTFQTDIFDIVHQVEESPCYLCARMRRGYLYAQAKELGCNKIALGHHFDDVIETILMSIIYGAEMRTMMPKLHSTNFEGMELIRPLYLVKEADIISWMQHNRLHFLQCACRFTADVADAHADSKRLEMKQLIASLRKINPQTDINIFRSAENVNLRTIVAYKDNTGKHNFLEKYETTS